MTERVHCLVCDHVYKETKPVLRDRCPKCGNPDMEQTVYLMRKSKNDYDDDEEE